MKKFVALRKTPYICTQNIGKDEFKGSDRARSGFFLFFVFVACIYYE